MLPEWESTSPRQRPLKAHYYQDQGYPYYPNQNSSDRVNVPKYQDFSEDHGQPQNTRNSRASRKIQHQSLDIPTSRRFLNDSLDYSRLESSPNSNLRYADSVAGANLYNGAQSLQRTQKIFEDNNTTKNDRKAYGKFLLDQMKLNQDKKVIGIQKKREEDQRMLNENNFFDGFGRSRNQIIQKYRTGLNQSPLLPRNEHQGFDKINNHNRNYDMYNSPMRIETRLAPTEVDLRQPLRDLPPIVKKQPDERPRVQKTGNQNSHPDALDDFSYSVMPIDYETDRLSPKRREVQDNQKPMKQSAPNDQNQTSNNLEAYQSPVEANTDNSNLRRYLSKREYHQALDEQVREKQQQKKTQKELEAMQDKIDHLRLSKERLTKELEAKAASPKIKNQDTTPYIAVTRDLKPTKEDKNETSKKTLEDNEASKNSVGTRRTNQSTTKMNATNQTKMYPNSQPRTSVSNPPKTIEYDQDERPIKPLTKPSKVKADDPPNEVHGYTKGYLQEIASVDDYLKSPIKAKDEGRTNNIDRQDSRDSLEGETQLVPLNSSNVTNKLDRLRPRQQIKPEISTSPQYYSDERFFKSKIDNDYRRSPSLNAPIEKIRSEDMPYAFLSNNVTSSLESNDKRQVLKQVLETVKPRERIERLGSNATNHSGGDFLLPKNNRERYHLNSVDKYSTKDPFEERPIANRYPNAANNTSEDKYLHVIATNTTKYLTPDDTNAKFYQPRYLRVEILKKENLKKRGRGIKRKRKD